MLAYRLLCAAAIAASLIAQTTPPRATIREIGRRVSREEDL